MAFAQDSNAEVVVPNIPQEEAFQDVAFGEECAREQVPVNSRGSDSRIAALERKPGYHGFILAVCVIMVLLNLLPMFAMNVSILEWLFGLTLITDFFISCRSMYVRGQPCCGAPGEYGHLFGAKLAVDGVNVFVILFDVILVFTLAETGHLAALRLFRLLRLLPIVKAGFEVWAIIILRKLQTQSPSYARNQIP